MSEHLYFAYGSNLEPVQMRRRCPASRVVTRAVLPGHRLTFPVASEGDWAGGVASVEPHERDNQTDGVHGVVYAVNDADLASLDVYEAVAEGMYRRERVVVVDEAGESIEAWTYFASPDPAGPTPPSRRYLDAILRGARHHGLPGAYVQQLAAIATRD
ncbi:MAG: gamma-glutamylcyclotransferase [Planctomycetota bacterium]